MTEKLVPDQRTPAAPADIYDALTLAWPTLCQDATMTRAARLVLVSQWALETAFGRAMHCHNLGNAKHVEGDGHDYCQFECGEEMPSRWVTPGPLVEVVATYAKDGEPWSSVRFHPPHPATSFLAFDTLEDGVVYYMTEFRGRWRAAWPHALAGDVAAFSHALHSAGYYTADEASYTAGMLRCYHQLDASIPPDPDTIPSPALLASEAAELAAPTGATEEDIGEGQS